MIKINNTLLFLFCVGIMLFSCNKKQEERSDLDKLRNSNNKKSYPVTKMDSVQAIQFITKQKIQDLYDLSALYTSGNRDTEIDSIIYQQMMGYFITIDSSNMTKTLKDLDSLKVKEVKVNDITVRKLISGKDTLDLAQLKVDYYGADKRKIGTFDNIVQYTLKTTPVKFKKEFKFYFLNFNYQLPKDSVSVGKTK